KAEHRTLRTHYAVKLLHAQYSADEVAVERFRHEAIACSRLQHENIVFVTDFGFEEGLGLYITMEFLDGLPLGTLLRRKTRLPLGQVVRIADQIAAAMSAAHRLDIIHRDLKPDNVVVLDDSLRPDSIKVLDFGIAKVRSSDQRSLTNVGEAIGTPAYMSPESLVDKDKVGGSSDIYALGCLIYEMITGNPPFWEGSDFQILSAHVTQTPALLSEHIPELAGTAAEGLVASMLGKRPADRPESMESVREELQDAIYELVEKGIEGAEYRAEQSERNRRSGDWDTLTVSDHTIRMTGVVQRIRELAPDSASAALLSGLPDSMSGSVTCLAVWGIIQHELIESVPDSEAFDRAVNQALLLTQAVLESNPGARRSRNQARYFRGMQMVFEQLSKERLRILVRELRPLASNPLFPSDLLPRENSGSWSAFRALLSTEISLRGFRRKDGSFGAEPDGILSARRRDEPHEDGEGNDLPLMDKLKQDLSVRSVKSVLLHDLTASGKRRALREVEAGDSDGDAGKENPPDED
ncbi:MAG: serine/threonine-protein kinase, partial [Myxococcota bacterium]|nr:serine/threonine-protein kinase [Myxococcota bacterium]